MRAPITLSHDKILYLMANILQFVPIQFANDSYNNFQNEIAQHLTTICYLHSVGS